MSLKSTRHAMPAQLGADAAGGLAELPVDPAAESRWRRAPLPLLTWPALDGMGLSAVISTRYGGASAGRYASLNLGLHVGDRDDRVLANRTRLAQALGHEPADFVFAEQAHGPNVTVAGEQHRGRGSTTRDDALKDTDALITATPGLVLSVLVADCVPIVLADPVRRVLACVHAGWRGTVTGVLPAALEQLRRLGGDPANVIACMGPAIHPDRYQVGEEVLDAATIAFGAQAPEVITPDGDGRWRFDLWEANTRQLLRAGVPADQIHVAEFDTGPGTPFYSHRSEGRTGRFGLFAWLHAGDEG